MTEDRRTDAEADAAAADAEWKRRKRRAEVFGETLPETTRDERGESDAGDRSGRESATDRWLKAQVPPHHGG
ncbi:hypothetical protein [Nocardioides stalactiti]|uniref:hypothetical protein n=1 Tax=Nocardioides stalactiti TaxID=2755356 RepID=UPI0016009AEF|nr:hypothetical protein [Nocardioides stalactiti]